MKSRAPFAALFVIALVIVALLPLYIERTMTELMFADGSGGAIEWGWKRGTLREYSADYRYMQREQKPLLWLGVNVGLALGYATLIAVPLHLARRKKT